MELIISLSLDPMSSWTYFSSLSLCLGYNYPKITPPPPPKNFLKDNPTVFSLMYLDKCINTSKCTLPGFDEKFSNIELPSQPLKFLITGKCIIFGEYHIKCKSSLIKLFTCINYGIIQVLSHNRSSISILIYRNIMVVYLLDYG